MAKTNTKKGGKAPSLHSRAARRATSPSINTDKSLKDVQPPSESLNQRPSVLGLYQNAGVNKKAKRGRKAVLSSRARRRHERGLERAEEILDRTAVKVSRSKDSARNIDGRKKTWDEINASAKEKEAAAAAAAGVNKFAGLADDGGEDEDEDDNKVDEMDVAMQEAGEPATAVDANSVGVSVPAPAPPPQDEDEIL